MFDGVHIGHRQLVETARSLADRHGDSVTVYTFSNHPMQLLRGSVSLLSDNKERERLLLEAGADSVYMEPFDEEMCTMQPEVFLERLNRLFAVKGIVCGFNYTFGHFGAGKPEMLLAYGKEHNVPVEVVSHFDALGAPVSSTRVRNMLVSGDTESALRLLGHPFYLAGSVVGENTDGGFILAFDKSLTVPFPGSYSAVENGSGIRGAIREHNGVWAFYPETGSVLSGTVSFSVTGRIR